MSQHAGLGAPFAYSDTRRKSRCKGRCAGIIAGRPLWSVSQFGKNITMSLLFAALALSLSVGGTVPPDPSPAPAVKAEPASAAAALDWLALVDNGQWKESWKQAGILFRSEITSGRWKHQVQPVREPLGAVVSREQVQADPADNLPGAPAGDYVVLQFATAFANMPGAIEVVTLAREESGWAVIGYFVRAA